MQRYSGWFAFVFLLASCSQQTAPPTEKASGATASAPVPPQVMTTRSTPLAAAPAAVPTTTSANASLAEVKPVAEVKPLAEAPPAAAVAPSELPIKEVVVRYDSKSPEVVVVNGNMLKLTELDQMLPGEWRRLPAPSSERDRTWEEFRIQIDGLTPFSVIRRIHDSAQAAGVRRATLVVDEYVPPRPAKVEEHPLRISLPKSKQEVLEDPDFLAQSEVLSVHARSENSNLASVRLDVSAPFRDSIADLNQYVAIKVAAAGENSPTIVLYSDDRLIATELAKLVFACEYKLNPLDQYASLVKEVYFAFPSEAGPRAVKTPYQPNVGALQIRVQSSTSPSPTRPGSAAKSPTTEALGIPLK